MGLFPGEAPFWGPMFYPPGALEVGVNTLVRSQEGSREAGLHVGSRGIAAGRVQDHMRGWGYVALHRQMQ